MESLTDASWYLKNDDINTLHSYIEYNFNKIFKQ